MNDSKVAKIGNVLGAALRKKTDQAGKAIGTQLARPEVAYRKYKQDKHDKNYALIKEYQKMRQRGGPVDSKANSGGLTGDRRLEADYETVKDYYNKQK
jgi:hypothetical protein